MTPTLKTLKASLIALPAAGLLALAALPAHAQDASLQSYAGASLASPHYNSSVAGVDDSGSGLSGKIYYGYRFTPNYSLELGLMNLGHMRNSAGEVKGWGGYIDGVGRWPVGSNFSILGRVGLTEARFDTPLGHDNGGGYKLGAGVQYDINPSMAVVGEYEYYHYSSIQSSTAKIGQFSVGLKLGF